MIEVSVVVTTKNEQAHIGNCLKSVVEQDFPAEKIEMILVDNNSTDDTKKIAAAFTSNIYDFGPERSAQRNFGVRKARGKYILYLDADMILSKNIISSCVRKCEKEDLLALYIPEKIVGEGFWIKVRDFERSFYNATVVDCVRFIRKEVFEKVKGFNENLTGPEDWDFDRKVRDLGKVSLIDDPIYHNEGSFDIKRYLGKKRYYSKSFEKYTAKWGKDDKDVKKQLGFFYRFFGVFLEKGKWVHFLLHPVLVIAMYFLRFLVAINYVTVKRG